MSNVWFVGDLHWGHRNITKFRPFDTEEEHRRVTKANLIGCLKKRDTLWILGDSVFTGGALKDLQDVIDACADVRCTIGNHCGQHMDAEEYNRFIGMFSKVYGITKKYKCWLAHAPIHPDELRGNLCVHGHVHTETIQIPDETFVGRTRDDPRYFNMSLENHNYMPRDLRWLRGEIENRR